MDKDETAAPSAKQKIATIARKLARSAPTADVEFFYTAVAEEFERQIDWDQKRATTIVPGPANANADAK